MKAGPEKVRRRRHSELPFRMGTLRWDSGRDGAGVRGAMAVIVTAISRQLSAIRSAISLGGWNSIFKTLDAKLGGKP